MAPLRVAGLVYGALGALALDVQRPQLVLKQNSTGNSNVVGAKSGLDSVEGQHKTGEGIQPSLAPKSHNKFFGKDYPDDLRPTIDSAPKWSYPYPKVQSDAKYDADYVKDENNDGGHWKAQMDYDEIKMKYIKQQAVVREAAIKAGYEKDEAMKAAKVKDEVWLRKNNADAEAAKAAEEVGVADAELTDAEKEEQAKEWEAAQKAGKSKALFEAEQRVEQAEAHLKDCEKAVTDAKAELANVQAAEAAKDAADHQAKEDRVAAAKGKQADKASASKSKKATLSEKQAAAAAAAKEADAAKGSADKEYAEELSAEELLKHEQEKLEQLASDLEDAENRLRKFRGEPPLPKQHGVQFHAEGHSGAVRLTGGLFALVAAALAAGTM